MYTAFINFAEAQVAGGFATGVFAVTFYALTIRRLHGVPRTSALLMSLGYFLAAVQFCLQRVFSFHEHDMALGLSVNFSFFMLITYVLYIALLYLMRQGQVRTKEWLTVPVLWLVGLAVTIAARVSYHYDAQHDYQVLMWAEYFVAVLYFVENIYLFGIVFKTYQKLKMTLEEFFDRSTSEMIGWIRLSVIVLSIMSFCIPVLLFFRNQFLVAFLFVMVGGMAYLFATFTLYCVSNDAVVASQADAVASEIAQDSDETSQEATPMNEADLAWVSQQLSGWLHSKGFRQHSTSIADVAQASGLSIAILRRWLTATGQGSFSQWLSHLRVEHSKVLLTHQSKWTIDAIAQECGFANRQGLIRAFKKENGCSPTAWITTHKED